MCRTSTLVSGLLGVVAALATGNALWLAQPVINVVHNTKEDRCMIRFLCEAGEEGSWRDPKLEGRSAISAPTPTHSAARRAGPGFARAFPDLCGELGDRATADE
jgi:hypothetical protein